MNKIIFISCLVLMAFSCKETDGDLAPVEYAKFQPSDTRLASIKLDNQLLCKLNYDSAGRMNLLEIYNSDSIVQSISYKYNSNNQLVEKKDGYIVETFLYEDKKLAEISEINPNNIEWNRRIVYNYKNGRIIDASVYMTNKLTGHIEFQYDNNGNTTSRKEFGYDSNMLISEYKCSYGKKMNPFPLNDFYPHDMIQNNNISYSYRFAAIMSSYPPEYNAEFTYNDQDLIIEEKRYYKSFGNSAPQIYTYEYQKK